MMARRHCKHPRYHRKSKESCRSHEWLCTALPNSLVNSSSAVWMAAEWPRPLNSTIWRALLIPSSRLSDFKTAMTGDNFSRVNGSFHQLLYILPQGYWFLLVLRSQLVQRSMLLVSQRCPHSISHLRSSCCWLLRRSRTLQEGLFLLLTK